MDRQIRDWETGRRMAKRKVKGKRNLQAQLAAGEARGLIHIARLAPEAEYIFRHPLVHEASYRSLLKQDRRKLHAAVGEVLERAYPDRGDELAGTLAYHFQ